MALPVEDWATKAPATIKDAIFVDDQRTLEALLKVPPAAQALAETSPSLKLTS